MRPLPLLSRAPAFTRTDLLVGLAVLGVLSLLAWPSLAQPRERSLQLVCVSNLQRIGQGFHGWGNDHTEALPWRVHTSLGGTFTGSSRVGNAWFEFAWVSNYLASPRLLVCPADDETLRVASDFSNSPNGGLLHFSFRANAVSYMLGLDAFSALPLAWVSGDRNLRFDRDRISCSSGVVNAAGLFAAFFEGQGAWTNGVHNFQGNILRYDGNVIQTSNPGLTNHIETADDNGQVHLLMPR